MCVERQIVFFRFFNAETEIIVSAGVDSVGSKHKAHAAVVLPLLHFFKCVVDAAYSAIVVSVRAYKSSCEDCTHTCSVGCTGAHVSEHMHIHVAGGSCFYHLRTGEHRAPICVLVGELVLTGGDAAEKPFLKGKIVRKIAENRHISVAVTVDKSGYGEKTAAVDHLVGSEAFGYLVHGLNGVGFDVNIGKIHFQPVAVGKKCGGIFNKYIHD